MAKRTKKRKAISVTREYNPTYEHITEGDWFSAVKEGQDISCCDCGLVHSLEFRLRGGCIQYRFRLRPRQTGQIRRWNKIRVVRPHAFASR